MLFFVLAACAAGAVASNEFESGPAPRATALLEAGSGGDVRYRKFSSKLCDMEATLPELLQVQSAHAVEWNILGKFEAWWSVISVPEYKGMQDIPLDAKRRFYASGRSHVHHVMTSAIQPETLGRGSVLDFGCGVGRLAFAFAAKFEEVECVDQSVHHMNIARHEWAAKQRRAANASRGAVLGKVDFTISTPDLIGAVRGKQFDFVHTVIVLQHMVSPLQVAYVEQLCDVLKPGGQGYLQIPTRTVEDSTLNVGCDFTKVSNIQMHHMPEDELKAVLTRRGCSKITIETEVEGWGDSTVARFVKEA